MDDLMSQLKISQKNVKFCLQSLSLWSLIISRPWLLNGWHIV